MRIIAISLFSFFIICIVSFVFAGKFMKRRARQEAEGYENVPFVEIIYFFSESCGYCVAFDPIFQKVTQELVASPSYDNVNVSISKMERRDIINKEHKSLVHAFPTILIYKNDKYVDKIVGSQDEDSLRGHLRRITM